MLVVLLYLNGKILVCEFGKITKSYSEMDLDSKIADFEWNQTKSVENSHKVLCTYVLEEQNFGMKVWQKHELA